MAHFDADVLQSALCSYLDQRSNQLVQSCFVVAVSGGADSMALLDAMATLQRRGLINSLRALHVDHGLQWQSGRWASMVEQYCQQQQLRYLQMQAKMAEQGRQGNVEARARTVRYQWFREQLREGEILLTAHHLQDNSETMLQKLLRGEGAMGIAPLQSFGAVEARWRLLRPLLGIDKAALLAYVQQHRVAYVDDPSNTDTALQRNYLRKEVLPRLRQCDPQADLGFLRSADLQQQRLAWLQQGYADLIDAHANPIQQTPLDRCAPLRLSGLLDIAALPLADLLRFWLHRVGVGAPTGQQFKELLRQINTTATAQVELEGFSLCYTNNHLHLVFATNKPAHGALAVAFTEEVVANAATMSFPLNREYALSLNWQPCPRGIQCELLTSGLLRWRLRQGGERVRLLGREHHVSLKKAWQTAAVPRWCREQLPLLMQGDVVYWAYGLELATHDDDVMPSSDDLIQQQSRVSPQWALCRL